MDSAEVHDEFNYAKFKQVAHFLIHKTTCAVNVGKTVLYKLHYFNDFDYYELHEIKMTGEKYSKIEHGPAPRHFDKVIEELITEGKIQQIEVEYYDRRQIRYISLKEPELNLLNAVEYQHLENVISKYSMMNATQIEALSHRDVPWEATREKEDINYDLVFYRDPEMSVREYQDD